MAAHAQQGFSRIVRQAGRFSPLFERVDWPFPSPVRFDASSMFDKLPSLRGFQPKFYSGGPTRFHLPLLYDLVAEAKPKRVVAVGFGDGQAFSLFARRRTNRRSIANASRSGGIVRANRKRMMSPGGKAAITARNSTASARVFFPAPARPSRKWPTTAWMFCCSTIPIRERKSREDLSAWKLETARRT